MNMNMFREVLDPQLNQTKTANKSLYDKSKPTDTALSKKHLGAITWDLTGSKLVTGAADGSIKVRDSHRILSLDIQSRGFGVNEKTIRVQSSL